jgi:putative ABC transport system ATP-binding protein
MVKTENLSKSYLLGEVVVHALNGVSLSIREGEFVALMGASGSGKSTLLHLLGGVETPSAGQVWIDGQCLSDLNDNQITLFRRTSIGIVFQFFNLIPTLTVEENVALPLLIARKRLADYKPKIEEVLRLVGLSDQRLHKPPQLSGGQQQRVGIARALVIDPKLMLLDEPTGNLDSKTGAHILDLLAEMHRVFHCTIAMVTHNPVDAQYAERTVFLKDGVNAAEFVRGGPGEYSAAAINNRLLQL